MSYTPEIKEDNMEVFQVLVIIGMIIIIILLACIGDYLITIRSMTQTSAEHLWNKKENDWRKITNLSIFQYL